MKRAGFTLLEMLVSVALLGVLCALTMSGISKVRTSLQAAKCLNNLRQLSAATALYLADNRQVYFAYTAAVPEGQLWYFGLETGGGSEGNRDLDTTRSALFPYINQVGGIELCPSFPYESALWKPKFKGASYGYGYNIYLSNKNALTIENPSRIILFGDCAQVNGFQPPASATNPMIEEFYLLDRASKTVHFRHGDSANILFLDGHIEKFTMCPGTLDARMPGANVGRITEQGSMEYLQ